MGAHMTASATRGLFDKSSLAALAACLAGAAAAHAQTGASPSPEPSAAQAQGGPGVLQTPSASPAAAGGADTETRPGPNSPGSAPPGAGSPTVGEVVVTAQRREQRIQDVGIAISAYTGAQLRDLGVGNSIDVARLTPGVSVSSAAGGQVSDFSIRGVTQNDISDTTEAPNAVYVDDTYIPEQPGQIFGSFDLQRVEVLEGPQGTLFGRNATGGLIQFVPNKPTKDFDGFLDAEYGRFEHRRIEGGFGGAITDKIQVRISGLYNAYDPIYKNLYPAGVSGLAAGQLPGTNGDGIGGQDLGNDDANAVRVQIQAEPTPKLTVRVVGSYYNDVYSENPYNVAPTAPVFNASGQLINAVFAGPGETRLGIGPGGIATDLSGVPTTAKRPVPGGDAFGYVPTSARSLTLDHDFALEDLNYVRTYDAAIHVNYDFDQMSLVSISDWRHFVDKEGTDVDAGPENVVDYIAESTEENFSQEVRLASSGHKRFRWTVGGYYLYINSFSHQGFTFPNNSLFAGGPGAIGADSIDDVHLLTHSGSGFGQIEYDLLPKLTFIAGGRIIDEHQAYTYDAFLHASDNDYTLQFGPPLGGPEVPSYADKREEVLYAGKLQLEYRPSRNLLTYFGVNRGVKAGSFNSPLAGGGPVLPQNEFAYKPEELTSYEGGFKSTLLDGRATLDASVYYYHYHNYQAYTFIDVSGVVNNDQAQTYGLEATLGTHPFQGLTVNFGLSLLNARIYDVVLGPGVSRTTTPSFTPAQQYTAQISYTFPWDFFGGRFSFAGDGSYRTKVFGNIRNFDADVINDYFLGNGHIFWKRDHYKLGVGVDNIFDKRYNTVNFDLATLGGSNEVSYGLPRFWNISLRYTY